MVVVIRRYIFFVVFLLIMGGGSFFLGRSTAPVSNLLSVRGSLNYVGSNIGSSYVLLKQEPTSITAKEVAIRRVSRSIGVLRVLEPVLSRAEPSQTQNIGGGIIALRSLVEHLTLANTPQAQAQWVFLRTKILRVLSNTIRNHQSTKSNGVFVRSFAQRFAQLHKNFRGAFQP